MVSQDNTGRQKPESSPSFFDHKYFPAVVGGLFLVLLSGLIYFIDIFPDYSHLRIKVFSGPQSGNYHEKIEEASRAAKKKRGTIENISTHGSLDNIERILKSRESGLFALVQDGMPIAGGMQLVAYLPSPESMFFIGPEADRIRSLADLRNARIGIGPRGSGTAHASELLFALPRMKSLKLKLSYHAIEDQLSLLRSRGLDIGVFIIREKSTFMEKVIGEYGMQIAEIKQSESISQRLPFLQPGIIPQGYYDPVGNIPGTDKKILRVNTILVASENVKRSQVIGLLDILSKLHPSLISHNRDMINWTGLSMSGPASDFFNNQGPEILDRYAPRLMDFIPVSNLIQIAMALSVLFNLIGMGNRFRLWRLDAVRLSIEDDIFSFFGRTLLPGEVALIPPSAAHESNNGQDALIGLITRFEMLEKKCRRQSQSFLVPMGGEMSYRYQEEIISRNLAGLRSYLSRLNRV